MTLRCSRINGRYPIIPRAGDTTGRDGLAALIFTSVTEVKGFFLALVCEQNHIFGNDREMMFINGKHLDRHLFN